MIYEKIERLATEEYGITIKQKKDVWWQKWIAKLLFFNPRYLENYSNGYLNSVHMTENASWRTLAHEIQHVIDMRRMLWIFFVLLYMSPQVLALVALGAFWSPWFLLALIGLLPLPAIGRLWLEARAYGVSLACRKWAGYSQKSLEESLEWYTKLMSGSAYYFTMPIKPIARWSIGREYKRVMKREAKLHQELYEIITQ